VRDHHAFGMMVFLFIKEAMESITITLISVGLAMDALAVSLGIGTSGQIASMRGKIRLAAHFGIFQSLMTALGWIAGATIIQYVKGFDHWIAFGLLGYVGINLIRAGLSNDRNAFDQDPSTGKTLVMLSVATSIDAFAVGLSIAFIKVPIGLSILMIGLTAFVLSAMGLFAGIQLGDTFGKRMEVVGGVLLLAIGFRLVVIHVVL
jgi:manganese efflux pump family protein